MNTHLIRLLRDIARRGARVTTTWTVGTKQLQRSTVDALLSAGYVREVDGQVELTVLGQATVPYVAGALNKAEKEALLDNAIHLRWIIETLESFAKETIPLKLAVSPEAEIVFYGTHNGGNSPRRGITRKHLKELTGLGAVDPNTFLPTDVCEDFLLQAEALENAKKALAPDDTLG